MLLSVKLNATSIFVYLISCVGLQNPYFYKLFYENNLKILFLPVSFRLKFEKQDKQSDILPFLHVKQV